MGLCEGVGKPYFIIVEKNFEIPTYFENRLYLRADLSNKESLVHTISNITESVQHDLIKKTKSKSSLKKNHDNRNLEVLERISNEISKIRLSGNQYLLINTLEEVIRTINLNYVKANTSADKGVDFALWSNELSTIIGNPIILEIKFGSLSESILKDTSERLNKYIKHSDAKAAILLYLDKNGSRFNTINSLQPLIISYDVEDFINDLSSSSFESLVLSQRNKIAHGEK